MKTEPELIKIPNRGFNGTYFLKQHEDKNYIIIYSSKNLSSAHFRHYIDNIQSEEQQIQIAQAILNAEYTAKRTIIDNIIIDKQKQLYQRYGIIKL